MSSIKAALWDYLRSLSPLVELVQDRIYFGERPPTAPLPCVTFFRSGGASVQVSEGPGGMGIPKFTLECWGESGEDVEAMAAVLRESLDSWDPGLMGTIWVGAMRVDNLTDDKVPPAFGEARSDHRVSIEVTIWHDE